MTPRRLGFALRPRSAFVTPLVGDTLFGQLCWALRHLHGEAALSHWLRGYTEGRPFLVVGTPLPAGHVPLPCLPPDCWDAEPHTDAKTLRQRRWLPVAALAQPARQWRALARADADVPGACLHLAPYTHNTLSRQSGSTGLEQFAPYTVLQRWHAPTDHDQAPTLTLTCIHDAEQLDADALLAALRWVGELGYGADANTGMGRFDVTPCPLPWPEQPPAQANAWLTLGPLVPAGLALDSAHSYYTLDVRFGRHGDQDALSGLPFKRPVMLAHPGAVLAPAAQQPTDWSQLWLGQGVGGVSNARPDTVHQGYAPVLAIACPRDTP